MNMNKERFLRTTLGKEIVTCITNWNSFLELQFMDEAFHCRLQWEAYQLALKEFYDIEYHFTRTDDYFGVCTEDEEDWLFKVERR